MLNISKQIYAGIDTSVLVEGGLCMAEVMPAGETTVEINKINKAKNQGLDLREFDNIPLPGFTLHDSGYKSYDTFWTIIDPRGFMVKISSRNLTKILKVTGITEGLIQQKCIWIRDDNSTKMHLMPISSKEYNTVIENTELIENKISMDEVNIGDTVLLQNKMIGQYVGVMTLYGSLHDRYGKTELKPQIMHKRQIIELSSNQFYYQSNLNILKVISKGVPVTLEESAKYVNSKIRNGAAFSDSEYFQSMRFNSRGIIRHASTSNTKNVSLEYEPITRTEAEALYYGCYDSMDSGALICEDADGRRYVINYSYMLVSGVFSLDTCHLMEIEPEFYSDMVIMKKPRDRGNRNVDKLVKFYKIVKHVKKETFV